MFAAPRFAWYGDDFTGATDTLAVLAQAGLRAMLFLGVPGAAELSAAGPLDAVGMAGAARAMDPVAMQLELARAGQFFKSISPTVLHYKVCSTFDSSPTSGSIGCAIRALRPFVEHHWVPIVGGQPSLGRYCAFSNLFAAAGTGGTVHRIDRHPTMRRHPVTPMNEADLRVHLAQQGLADLPALHFPQYNSSGDTLDTLLAALLQGQPQAVLTPTLLDLTDTSQLALVGRLIWQQACQQRLLAVGSSAVAQALVAHWQLERAKESASGMLETTKREPESTASLGAPAQDPVFVLAGSLSPMTARQVQAAKDYLHIPVDAALLVTETGRGGYAERVATSICNALDQGHHVMACTASPNAEPPANVVAVPADAVAQASARLLARVVQTQARRGTPLRRIGIAGGDTSSQAVLSLDLWGLSYKGTLCPGVTLSRAHSHDPDHDGLLLMLKGGQMGDENLFSRLLAV